MMRMKHRLNRAFVEWNILWMNFWRCKSADMFRHHQRKLTNLCKKVIKEVKNENKQT